ncbi:hypothetical protein B0T26DRAFT_872630 [Lasiosphaeria miniovina]|uniref:Uncharacterized protein n=1 Tax=Lasiosphaeria miniovina TaxID=1954250 RepID=A0AA40AM70_9PEZI|nr:uncharacterized protein B0T26DRAFT_872630 [Lasiosphaeria miniovina]KAK0718421.1 hypothetical protein B0T26DRAFT_872630 [Lasiosphaeria miniovina]
MTGHSRLQTAAPLQRSRRRGAIPSQFLNEARPSARYETIGYWGTHGRYVKKNILLGFVDEIGYDVNEIGHDASSIAESIIEHAIEEEEGDHHLLPDRNKLATARKEVEAAKRKVGVEEAAGAADAKPEDPKMKVAAAVKGGLNLDLELSKKFLFFHLKKDAQRLEPAVRPPIMRWILDKVTQDKHPHWVSLRAGLAAKRKSVIAKSSLPNMQDGTT